MNQSQCPECFEPVNQQATKCPHCTADIFHCSQCQAQVTAYTEYHRTSGFSWDEYEMAFCTRCNTQVGGPAKSGCFIATAAYGTALSPEIDLLRRTRDFHLTKSFLGRTFIKTYETLSPSLAKMIKGKKLPCWIVRQLLKPILFLCNKING